MKLSGERKTTCRNYKRVHVETLESWTHSYVKRLNPSNKEQKTRDYKHGVQQAASAINVSARGF